MHAAEKRAEMAEFIAMIRMEAAADEEDYWRTHTYKRLMRDFKEWYKGLTKKEISRGTVVQCLSELMSRMHRNCHATTILQHGCSHAKLEASHNKTTHEKETISK